MALTVVSTPVNIKNAGGYRFRMATFTGDTDIPAAGTGYTLTPANFNLNGISLIVGSPEQTGVYFITYTTAAGGATCQMRWFVAATAVEAALGENGVDTKVARAWVIGW